MVVENYEARVMKYTIEGNVFNQYIGEFSEILHHCTNYNLSSVSQALHL